MWTGFFAWLNGQVHTFIAVQVGKVAALLTPAIVSLATIYVMAWGYLQLTGQIQEPILDGLKRIFIIAAVLIFSLGLAGNLAPILDVFVAGLQNLAAGILGATPMGTVDTIWAQGASVGDSLLSAGTVFDAAGVSYIAAGVIVYAAVGLTTIYVAFLLALALVALAIILALGPFFVAMLFFDSTKRFFEAWIAQLANYALIIVLTATAANLLLKAITTPLNSAVAAGVSVTVAEGFRLSVFCVFVFLLMRQILPMASGLASGIALSTSSLMSRTMAWGLGRSAMMSRGMWDAMTGQGTTRWDNVARKAGYWAVRGPQTTARALWRMPRTANTFSRRRLSRAAEIPDPPH